MLRLLLCSTALAALVSAAPLSRAVAQSFENCGTNSIYCDVGGSGEGGGGGHLKNDLPPDFYSRSSGGSGVGGGGGQETLDIPFGLFFSRCAGGGGIGGGSGLVPPSCLEEF